LVTLGAHPSVTPDTLIFRITDKGDGTTYLTRSFQAHFRFGGLTTGNGTTTFELKGKLKEMSPAVTHVDSADPWSYQSRDGLGLPVVITVSGYDFATFQDLETSQVQTIRKFRADAIRAGDVPELSPKRDVNSREIHDVARDGNLATIRLLLREGPGLVFSKNSLGDTPLHTSVASGQKEAAELLLANGAEVDAKNNYGSTPLHYAADYNHRDLAELLLANNANVDAKDDKGYTPIDIAVVKGHNEVAELLSQHGGKDRSTQSTTTEMQKAITDVHSAARQGNLVKVKALLAHYPDLVSGKDGFGDTPLHSAAESGQRDVAEFLLANKAEVNVKNKYGSTPLHYAAGNDHKDVAELLLANGAEVNVRNDEGKRLCTKPRVRATQTWRRRCASTAATNKLFGALPGGWWPSRRSTFSRNLRKGASSRLSSAG
jgi:ankyrin repeat protein